MDSISIVYDMCQNYLIDRHHTLSEKQLSTLRGWVRSRSWKQLAKCVTLYDVLCNDVESRRTLSQVQAFFKKNASMGHDFIETRQNALATFERGERICRITNKRLDYYHSTQLGRLPFDLSVGIARAQDFIVRCLGSFDDFLEELPKRIRVTGGATSTRSRRLAQPYRKVGLKPVATRRAEPYLKALAAFYGYPSLRVRYTSANRVEFVPKNCFTDRTIACEPEGNVVLQLAFDDYVKTRLKKFGIDLSKQSLNQELARLGSLRDEDYPLNLATVDIENASGTLAYNTVALLFPQEWFDYLCDVRSPHYRVSDSGLRKYAMFSSMGNGATFTVETLVFAACCSAVADSPSHWTVYGDDIVIPSQNYRELVRLLRHFGFKVNAEKSFTSGPFRESCGKDWYEGVDITPFYVRQWRERGPVLAHNINGLCKVSVPHGRVWHMLRELVRNGNLPIVPWTLDTMEGVHVDPFTAYKLKLIRFRHYEGGENYPQVPSYRAFRAKTSKGRSVHDSRTLFLWHLDKNRCLTSEPAERSWVPSLVHKYVRKWVRWQVPATGVPTVIALWSDFLFLI